MDTNQSLERTISDDQRTALALAISRADGALPAKLDAVADQLGVSVGDLAALLNEQSFIQLVRGFTRAQAQLTFHNLAVDRLVDLVANGKAKQALAAIQLLGRLTGDLTPHKIVDLRMTFEDLRKRETGGVDPLANLFEIRGDVIEAEIKEEVATDDYEEWETENAS